MAIYFIFGETTFALVNLELDQLAYAADEIRC